MHLFKCSKPTLWSKGTKLKAMHPTLGMGGSGKIGNIFWLEFFLWILLINCDFLYSNTNNFLKSMFLFSRSKMCSFFHVPQPRTSLLLKDIKLQCDWSQDRSHHRSLHQNQMKKVEEFCTNEMRSIAHECKAQSRPEYDRSQIDCSSSVANTKKAVPGLLIQEGKFSHFRSNMESS